MECLKAEWGIQLQTVRGGAYDRIGELWRVLRIRGSGGPLRVENDVVLPPARRVSFCSRAGGRRPCVHEGRAYACMQIFVRAGEHGGETASFTSGMYLCCSIHGNNYHLNVSIHTTEQVWRKGEGEKT
jgi:hypothetical protein